MAEYIERERAEIIFRDARLALKPEGCKDWNEYITRDMMLMNAEQAIHIIPAADVAPVRHGRWTQHYVGQENVPWGSDCSVCGEWLVIDRTVMNEKYHYCPNCGAKMDGGD